MLDDRAHALPRCAQGAALPALARVGERLLRRPLGNGDAREFKDARQLSVRFGNSPAVRLVQNGRDIGAPRCDTQVCTVAFGPAAAG